MCEQWVKERIALRMLTNRYTALGECERIVRYAIFELLVGSTQWQHLLGYDTLTHISHSLLPGDEFCLFRNTHLKTVVFELNSASVYRGWHTVDKHFISIYVLYDNECWEKVFELIIISCQLDDSKLLIPVTRYTKAQPIKLFQMELYFFKLRFISICSKQKVWWFAEFGWKSALMTQNSWCCWNSRLDRLKCEKKQLEAATFCWNQRQSIEFVNKI